MAKGPQFLKMNFSLNYEAGYIEGLGLDLR